MSNVREIVVIPATLEDNAQNGFRQKRVVE